MYLEMLGRLDVVPIAEMSEDWRVKNCVQSYLENVKNLTSQLLIQF